MDGDVVVAYRDALMRFHLSTGVDPHTDPAVQFAVSAALRTQHLHEERTHVGHVQNKGMKSAPARGLSPARVLGWNFGAHLEREISAGLERRPVKAAAKQVTIDVLKPLVDGGVLGTIRRAPPGDRRDNQLTVLIMYMWRHLGRPALSAIQYRDLALGLGLTHHVADFKLAWERKVALATAALFTFDPRQSLTGELSEDQKLLVPLYAAIGDMVYHPALQHVVRWRPDHRELVDYILRTQPGFDAVAEARGVESLIKTVDVRAPRMWHGDHLFVRVA